MGVEPLKGQQYEEMEVGEEVDVSDFEIVSYVRRALNSAYSVDQKEYSELIGLLHYKERLSSEDRALLVTCLKALSGAVTCIDGEHHPSLLETILNMSMWNYSPDVMDALAELITSLAVSSGKFLDACLGLLVSNFCPPRNFIDALKLPYGVARKEHVLIRVHSCLECIAGLVPLAPSRLCPVVRERMPKARQNLKIPAVVMFVENVFKLESSTIGELVGRTILISAVVDLLIDLDVEIGWDDILQDDPSKCIFEVDLEDELIYDDEDDGDEFPNGSLAQKRLWKDQVSDKLEKLDSLMVVTFEHLKFCKENGRLVEVFESFLHSFQSTILTAFKSKFAQFVIFYACSLDPEGCGVRFSELLADIYVNRNFPPLTRMSAVAYLASYLSRGKFVPSASIMSSLERLVNWCSDYCRSQNGDFDPILHRVFYAGCQAILYILCFRMRLIMDSPHLSSRLSSLPLRKILKNRLEPLQICLPTIVEEFVHQAESANLIDETGVPVTHDKLESELSKAFGGIERLDAFFPFDPCLLKKCDSFIRPEFVYWFMVKKTYNDENVEDEGSSDEDLEVIYPDANGTESHDEGEDYDEFNDSLNKMSITPRESFLKRHMEMPSKLRPSMSPESS